MGVFYHASRVTDPAEKLRVPEEDLPAVKTGSRWIIIGNRTRGIRIKPGWIHRSRPVSSRLLINSR